MRERILLPVSFSHSVRSRTPPKLSGLSVFMAIELTNKTPIPEISRAPCKPILQTLVGNKEAGFAWVRVEFFTDSDVSREHIYKTMELLGLQYDFWDK